MGEYRKIEGGGGVKEGGGLPKMKKIVNRENVFLNVLPKIVSL